jgi:hypothetical protein
MARDPANTEYGTLLMIRSRRLRSLALDEIKKLEESLAKTFKMSNLGDSKVYLGIDIDYN